MKRENSFILQVLRLGRPLFLTGGFIMHGLGVAMALYAGAVLNLAVLLWGQVAITAIHWMTHYSNDYFDLAADKANATPTRWSGGSRVLVEDVLPPRVALAAAGVLTGVAVAAVLVLVTLLGERAPLAVVLFALFYFLALTYSAPPLRWHSRGIGELVVVAAVPTLMPLIGYYLQTGEITWLSLLAVVPIGCLQFGMMLLIEFPDMAGDAAVGKRTLVVRWGGARAARLYVTTMVLAYALLPLLVAAGLPALVAGATALGLPAAAWLAWRVGRGAWANSSAWGKMAMVGVMLYMGTALTEAMAFLLLWVWRIIKRAWELSSLFS